MNQNISFSFMRKYNLINLIFILIIIFLYALSFLNINFFGVNLIYVPLLFSLILIVIGAIKDIINRKFGSEFFFIFATIIGIIAHEEKAITFVLIVFLIAEYLEEIIENRTESAIASLIKLIPTDVLVKVGDEEIVLNISKVQPGMLVIIKTGNKIPVDGQIVIGHATVNESALTGESKLIEKSVKNVVYAGTFIESGSIIVKVEKVGKETFFGKITQLLEEVQKKPAAIINWANRAAVYFTILVLFFIAFVWFKTHDLKLIITLLVFGSPLELVLVTPLTLLGGIAAAFYNGILIKGGYFIEKFASIDTIFFDKTGTLTLGKPKLVKIEVYDKTKTEHDILKLAAICEKKSNHVIARAVIEKAKEEKIDIDEPEDYISVEGHGIEILYKGEKYFLGNAHFVGAKEHGNIDLSGINKDESGLYSTFYLANSSKLCGSISIADEIKKEAKDTIDDLKKLGIKNIILLSGDREEVVKEVAQKLGITDFYSQVFPDEKLKMIKDYSQRGFVVAMVGDGINDAPALKQADIGIAIGAMGMEPAIEAADIVLMASDISKIVFLLKLSKKTLSKIKQNLIFGFIFTHVIGMILGLYRILNPIQAALFHGISDILIVLNSAQIIRFKGK